MERKVERFKYNMDLEMALCNLLGDRYYGSAGEFSDAKTSKEYLLTALKRIRKRLNEIITSDERLLMMVNQNLDGLENYVKDTSESVNNDWFIIARLLDLVTRLLGYDWAEGKVHRQIIYYQEREQEEEDHKKEIGDPDYWKEFRGDMRIQYEVIYLLRKRGLSMNQIARVLNISRDRVSKILKKIEEYEEQTGKEFLNHKKND